MTYDKDKRRYARPQGCCRVSGGKCGFPPREERAGRVRLRRALEECDGQLRIFAAAALAFASGNVCTGGVDCRGGTARGRGVWFRKPGGRPRRAGPAYDANRLDRYAAVALAARRNAVQRASWRLATCGARRGRPGPAWARWTRFRSAAQRPWHSPAEASGGGNRK